MPFIYKPRCFVDNLPAEVLMEVFANVVTSHSYHYTEEVANLLQEEALTFRRASQVSQFWRNVALHPCNHIWGSIINIDTSSSAWVEELITRSRNSPLTIQSLSCRREPNEDFCGAKWTSVFAEMARVKILHVALGDRHEDASQLMHATSNLQAPIIESFRVEYECHCALERPRATLFSFNGRLFDNQCPNLRDFVLTRVLFIQPTTDFSAIRLVHLDITPDFSSADLTVSQWLDVLETQPSLRYLTMTVQSTYGAEIYPASSRQVRLPNLEQFSIETEGIEGAQIFASLVLPSRCRIAFKIMEEEETFDDLSFIEILGETFCRCIKGWSGKGSTNNLELGSWGLEVDETYFVLRLGSEDDAWYNPRIQLLYYSSYNSPDEVQEVILSPLIDVIRRKGIVDAAHTCTLKLQLPITKNIGLTALFLQCSRNITHLRLIRYSLSFFSRLSLTLRPGTVLFPTLNHVTLENPRIDEFGFDHNAYGYFQSLQSISAVARRGIPTTTLRIDWDNETHVEFAVLETTLNSFRSKIELGTYVPGSVFEELREPRYWVGGDELKDATLIA
jgi:hypothetical protein